MNKEQTNTISEQPEPISKLIQKLRTEYAELKERVSNLHYFLCDIDFEKRVPDRVEQRLMREQLNMMLGYMDNLRQRISYQEEQQTRNMLEHAGDGKRGIDFVRDENEKVVAIVPVGLIPKGLDDVDLDKAFEELRKVMEAYSKESHYIETNHCGQDVSCQVGDGSAAVNEAQVPNSIKSLEGMQVIKVCGPKCKDCPCGDRLREYPSGRDMSCCVKVELVGGYMLCLSQLPNSIVTE